MIRLLGPKGTDECNAAGVAYHPHDDGYFHLPDDPDVLGPLMHTGGFSLAPDDVPPAPPEPRQTSIADVEALARTLPTGDLKAQLLSAIAALASGPRQTVKVRPPIGTTGFSHGGEHFEIGEDGLIDAPLFTLDSICDGPAGFTVVSSPDPPPPPAADDEAQADDAEPASSEPAAAEVVEIEAAAPAAEAEAEDAAPVAPVLPRLTIPNSAPV